MAGHRKYLHDDSDWSEVSNINSYAVFMGYLSMAIKGLGFLVLTWTTVILLGGFVSMLQKKDFWCLTFITLVQTAGVFDVVLNEKLSYMMDALFGGLVGFFSIASGEPPNPIGPAFVARYLFACVLMLVQLVVLAALLCPLAIMYMLGILMSGGISLWRLIQHDYEGNSVGEASNLAPAMDTLYYLALLQGVLFCYRYMLSRAGKKLARHVATDKCNDSALQLVSNYLRETRRGCEKDPSFARGRNFITDAIEKIGSNSPVDCISGVEILYATIFIVERELESHIKGSYSYNRQRDIANGQRMLMRHLVLSASSSRHMLRKLLETLDSTGLHDRETRKQAAAIVERLAFNINLEDFPRGIQHISSLIGTFQEYIIAEPYQREYEQHWFLIPSPAIGDYAQDELVKAYKHLLLQGLLILRNLATNENNCRVMSDTLDLVSRIMAPVISDLLHHTTDDHGAWSEIVERSMEVMIKLTVAPGETGAKLRREISSYEKAINTLWRILCCNKCSEELQLKAILILTRLYMDTTETRGSADFVVLKKESSGREDFVRMLVIIFTHDNKYSNSLRGYAGRALSEICFQGRISDAAIVRESSGDVNSVTEVLLHDKDGICRQAAAEILEHLCTHYTNDDQYLGKLKKAILEVIGEILCRGDGTHSCKEVDQDRFSIPKTDIENQCDGTQENYEQDNEDKEFLAVTQSIISAKLLSSLLSILCIVYDTMLISDLAPRLGASSFLNKLKESVVKRSDLHTPEHLSLYKAISKMVISMMEHGGSRFIKREDLESLIEALAIASKNMLDLDHSMVFRSANSSESSKLERCTLASLVKEAKELYAMVQSYNSLSG